ncbi:MAG TPA: hypothetical protein VFZ61_03650 [Polyangiales bacterium]
MDAAQYNKALAMTGGSYRVPIPIEQNTRQYAQEAAAVGAQKKAERDASYAADEQRMWDLVGLAANLYTGGAFGAATGAAKAAGGAAAGGAAGSVAPATAGASGFASGATSAAAGAASQAAGATAAGQAAGGVNAQGLVNGVLGGIGRF